ncbi:MAG TPA: metallophosphoesterase [Anaerolineae bacterium]|nr:metallophosphoesterase [Anaerolineae bacterium]
MRLAILADIHGNIHALQAVAARLEQLQPDAVIVVGDLINAVPFSSQVVDFIRNTDWIVLRGNHEFYYLDFVGGRAPEDRQDPVRWGQLHWLVEHLRPDQGAYLAALPDDLTLFYPGTEPIRLAHGTPGNHRMGFSVDMPADRIAAAIYDIEHPTFINAHTHQQIDRLITEPLPASEVGDPTFFLEDNPQRPPRTWHVINPGSVGLPLNGDPRAQFAIIESVSPNAIPGGWRVSHYRVAYDRGPALEGFYTSGMLARGGVISELFYWELVTAQREIPYFFLWRRAHLPEDTPFEDAFRAYKEATGRDAYVRQRDPLGSHFP